MPRGPLPLILILSSLCFAQEQNHVTLSFTSWQCSHPEHYWCGQPEPDCPEEMPYGLYDLVYMPHPENPAEYISNDLNANFQDPLPPNKKISGVKIDFYFRSAGGNIHIVFRINDADIGPFNFDNMPGEGCGKPIHHLALDNYLFGGLSSYIYGGQNSFSINALAIEGTTGWEFVHHVELTLFYDCFPAVETISVSDGDLYADGTQYLSDYVTQKAANDLTLDGVFYLSKQDAQGVVKDVFGEPLVVPFSDANIPRMYDLKVRLYCADQDMGGTSFKVHWEWDIKGKGAPHGKDIVKKGDATSRAFDIPVVAPTEVGLYTLDLTFLISWIDPATNTEESLPKKVLNVPLYTILNFSKPFASIPNPEMHLPSKQVIATASGYVNGAKTDLLAMQRLTDGIFGNSKHAYYPDRPSYTAGNSFLCTADASFRFTKYLDDLGLDQPVNMDCQDTSNLLYILARCLGINMSIYGIPKAFTTREILAMGNADWRSFPFLRHQTDEMTGNVYDATLHFRDKATDRRGYGAVSIPKDAYGSKLTAGDASGNTCSDPALLSIIY